MKRSLLLIALASLSAPLAAPKPLSVHVSNAQIKEGLPGVPDGVLYVTLKNTGQTNVKLLGGSTAIARKVLPMKNHAIGSHGQLDLTVRPGKTLAFTPGGNHLMLMGLRRAPKVGERVKVTLTFDAGRVTITVPVKGY